MVEYHETLTLYFSFQDAVDAAVKVLLDLKTQYKNATGKDWKPGQAPAPSASPAPATSDSPATSDAADLHNKITDQGNTVRKLKSEKTPKVSDSLFYTIRCFRTVRNIVDSIRLHYTFFENGYQLNLIKLFDLIG